MHELGLCSSIVEAVERRAGGRAVAAVTVRVGRLLHVHTEAFEQSFAIAAMGTVAAGATARLVLVPVRCACTSCGKTAESDEVLLACPACGSLDVRLTGGDELVLESLEYPAGDGSARADEGAGGTDEGAGGAGGALGSFVPDGDGAERAAAHHALE